MIIKLFSENPKFLDLLFKNPNTDLGLYARPLKNGVVIGNAMDAHHYDIVFQDTKYSYLPEDSNTIDFQSYCSPLVVLNISTDFFGHSLKSREDYMASGISWLNTTQGAIDTFPCEITIPTFYIHSSWYNNGQFLLTRYFPGVKVKQHVGRNFELSIQAPTVFEAINLLNLVALFTHITNEYGVFTYSDDSFATKYVRILTNIEKVPYFIFYLYIKRAVKNEKQFMQVKPIFEEYLAQQGYEADLTYYGTHQERVKYISRKLELDTSILDIGCGEFIYYKRMMNLQFAKTYYAIDQEERFEKLGAAIASRYDQDNLQFYKNINDCSIAEKVNIIMTEVIEHNKEEDAIALVQKAMEYDFNKIIITTPNVSFNQFYSDTPGSRHDDHHFEFNEAEFKSFIDTCVGNKQNVSVAIEYIGDRLNNIQPTQIAIIQNTLS